MKLCSICCCQFILSKSMEFPFSCFSFIDYAEHLLDLNLVLHIVRYKQIICLLAFHILLQKLDQCEICSVECGVSKSWDTKQCLVLIFWELSTIKFNIEFELCDVWAKLVTFFIVEIWNLYFWCLTLFTSEWVLTDNADSSLSCHWSHTCLLQCIDGHPYIIRVFKVLHSNSMTIKVLELRLILVDIRVSIQLSNSNSRL